MPVNRKGQTLVIILAVMILALGIGVAASTRFIKSLKNVSNTDLSGRALAVAESGAERMLALPLETLSDYINNGCGSNCTLVITGDDGVVAQADINLSFNGNTSGPYEIPLEAAKPFEINLIGYGSGKDLSLCINNVTLPNPLSVSALLVSGSTGSYKMDNYFFTDFGCHVIAGVTNPVSLRVKSIYDDVDVSLTPAVGEVIPSQGILIQSSGTVLDITKKVYVLKTNPVMPGEFDNVLYSKSTTQPLSN